MLSPREAGSYVASVADHVHIVDQGLDKCRDEIVKRIRSGSLSLECVGKASHEKKSADWVFVTSALNFCFWNDESGPQYLVTHKGKTSTGFMSLLAAFDRTLKQGMPLDDPKFYGHISQQKLNEYLMGDNDVPCPLIEQRVACLHEIARVLEAKYEGTFEKCVEKCGGSAQKLLQLVTSEFDCFRDTACYKGKQVAIYKRAQILIADLWFEHEGKGLGHFDDIDSITMFADYRVPQSLQYFGAFVYSDELMKVLNANEILENGSAFEVEIRGCSIEAVERLVRKINLQLLDSGRQQKMNAIQVDNFLWKFRREKVEEMVAYPYHKVRSIYY